MVVIFVSIFVTCNRLIVQLVSIIVVVIVTVMVHFCPDYRNFSPEYLNLIVGTGFIFNETAFIFVKVLSSLLSLTKKTMIRPCTV